jgi:hypothetical protein
MNGKRSQTARSGVVNSAKGNGRSVMRSAVAERFPVYGLRTTSHSSRVRGKARISMGRVKGMTDVPASCSDPAPTGTIPVRPELGAAEARLLGEDNALLDKHLSHELAQNSKRPFRQAEIPSWGDRFFVFRSLFPVPSSALGGHPWAMGHRQAMGKESPGLPGAVPFTDHTVPIANRE